MVIVSKVFKLEGCRSIIYCIVNKNEWKKKNWKTEKIILNVTYYYYYYNNPDIQILQIIRKTILSNKSYLIIN